MISKLITTHKSTILYGLLLACLLFLLKWLQLRLIIYNHAFEVYILSIALIFTGLGIWLARSLTRPKLKTVVIEKEVYIESPAAFTLNQAAVDRLNISKRELEVLQLMAEGLSNQEIASQLYLSLHTIKTHSSRLFEKLEAERRTQAVDTAKKLGLIPR